jgi:hypothetical protein
LGLRSPLGDGAQRDCISVEAPWRPREQFLAPPSRSSSTNAWSASARAKNASTPSMPKAASIWRYPAPVQAGTSSSPSFSMIPYTTVRRIATWYRASWW